MRNYADTSNVRQMLRPQAAKIGTFVADLVFPPNLDEAMVSRQMLTDYLGYSAEIAFQALEQPPAKQGK